MDDVALGAHVSIAGGLPAAIERGEALGCRSLQIFVRNPSQWRGRVLDASECAAFRRARAASRIGPVVAHASYLINLCASDRPTLERSREALLDELERCRRLGVDALILHPGAHRGRGPDAGLAAAADSLRHVLSAHGGDGPRLLLENTAGQGTVLGHRLEELATLLEATDGEALGVCLDTCHAFAAGYALHTEDGFEAFAASVGATVGFSRVGCVHLNDSKAPFAARRDRHANLGAGALGLDAFRRLLADPRFRRLPLILETPYGADRQGHRRDLEILRDLLGTTSSPPPGRR